MPEVRRHQGKPEQGLIEIRAHHQGSQTIIEVRDDGRGLNLDRIRSKAIDMGLATAEQLAEASTVRLLELLFEPGFSTASQVSELSGRGVGLDVVRSQIRSLKGNVTVSSELGQGCVFTLRIPLTLTIAKLLVGFVGSTAFALPSDSIEEILIPQPEQVKQSGGQRFLHWQDRIVPAYKLSELLTYDCPLPETVISEALEVVPSPDDWEPPMLLLSQDDNFLALEIDRLVTEQELVIKPFGSAIAPPSYIYGCTILGDGSLIPVINGAALLNSFMGQSKTATFAATKPNLLDSAANAADASTSSTTADAIAESGATLPTRTLQTVKASTILVIDDSITLRQTLVLTLQKVGYRVVQAKDGREAIEQLQKNTAVQLIICDVEMPNMNGFEFLSHRRQDPAISKIPIVMLTSRSSDKHRQLAMHLGANSYFTKPYIEQEFVAAVKTMLTQDAPVGVPALAP
jgi:chemotaxis family two-component system sensor histidine kinase/response regulator PixL